MLPMNELLQEGRYRVIRQIGHNETGSIYEGLDNILEKKIFINHFTYNGRKNLSDEEKILKGIKHESFLRVTDYFAELSGWFAVMESDEGKFLSDILNGEKTRFDISEVLRWTEQILDGFAYLHLNLPPVIYADLKPQNIFLTSDGQVKLLASAVLKNRIANFGPAKLSESALNYSPLEQIWSNLDSASQKVIIGSYDDAAEKILRQPLNARSDIYSLGVLMYQLLTGQMPKNALERSIEILESGSDPLVSPEKISPEVPPEIAEIIGRTLAVRRENRLDSAVIMRQILRTAFVRIKEREAAEPKTVVESPPQSAPAYETFETFTLDEPEKQSFEIIQNSPAAEKVEFESFAMHSESISETEDFQAAPESFENFELQVEMPAQNETDKKPEKPSADFFEFDEEDEEEILGIKKSAPVEKPKPIAETKPIETAKPVEVEKPIEAVKIVEKPAVQKETKQIPEVEKTEEVLKVTAPVVETPQNISVKDAVKITPEIAKTDYKKDYAPVEMDNLFEDAELNKSSKFSFPVIALVLFLIGGGAVGVWFFAAKSGSNVAVSSDNSAPINSVGNAPAEVPPSTPATVESAETTPVSNPTETAPETTTATTETDSANPVLTQETSPTAKKQTPVKAKPTPAKPQTASAKTPEKQPKKVTVDDLINDN